MSTFRGYWFYFKCVCYFSVHGIRGIDTLGSLGLIEDECKLPNTSCHDALMVVLGMDSVTYWDLFSYFDESSISCGTIGGTPSEACRVLVQLLNKFLEYILYVSLKKVEFFTDDETLLFHLIMYHQDWTGIFDKTIECFRYTPLWAFFFQASAIIHSETSSSEGKLFPEIISNYVNLCVELATEIRSIVFENRIVVFLGAIANSYSNPELMPRFNVLRSQLMRYDRVSILLNTLLDKSHASAVSSRPPSDSSLAIEEQQNHSTRSEIGSSNSQAVVNPKALLFVVEIGVFKGDFSVNILESNPDVFLLGVDPYIGKDGTFPPELAHIPPQQIEAIARGVYSRFGNRSLLVKGTSESTAPLVEDDSIDLIFIDGCHTYTCVISDIRQWHPKVKVGGVISGHDYSPEFMSVVHAVNEARQMKQLFIGEDHTWWYFREE